MMFDFRCRGGLLPKSPIKNRTSHVKIAHFSVSKVPYNPADFFDGGMAKMSLEGAVCEVKTAALLAG